MPATKVKALAPGFYAGLRAAGDSFTIVDDAHFGSWMEAVEPKDIERLAERAAELRQKIKRPTAIPAGIPATPAQLREPVAPTVPVAKPKPAAHGTKHAAHPPKRSDDSTGL